MSKPHWHLRRFAIQGRLVLTCLGFGALIVGCGRETKPDCPDPVTQTSDYMTETEKKLARLKTGFDPACK